MNRSVSFFRISVLSVVLLGFQIPLEMDSVRAEEANPAWQEEWEKTLQAAKREGKVATYGSQAYEIVFREFQKRYPEIKVVHVGGRGSQLAPRIKSERRAGKYLGDLYIGGATTGYRALYKGNVLDPIKPSLILPEVLDQSKWFKGKHRYMDDKGAYLFGFVEMVLHSVGYNPKLVDPREFKSYWDLLDPKWKGKMIAMDPTMGSAVNSHLVFMYNNPGLGPKFLRRLLGKMDLTGSRDSRQIVDWLAVGRYPISIFTSVQRAGLDQAKKQGLSVYWFGARHFKEGVGTTTSSGNVGLLNRAPHPNAAKVAINWLLSREGQMTVQRVRLSDSRRIDIPKDDVRPSTRRLAGGKYTATDSPQRRNMKPIFKIINEVWKKKR